MAFPRSLLAAVLFFTACDAATPPSGPPPGPVCQSPSDPACAPPPEPPPGPACLATVGELTAYPGVFSGTVVGGGPDLRAPEGACATQTGGVWYDLFGEDVVLRLAGLTPGQRYGVRLSTDEDLAFYVTAACPEQKGDVTGCLNFTDRAVGDETGTFVAAADAHWLVVDAFDVPVSGAFEVTVVPADCTVETADTDCGAGAPYCVDFTCAQCVSSFDCDAATPVCGPAHTCVAGPSACSGDDADDDAARGNDGPSTATPIAPPDANRPTVVARAICSAPSMEQDWYTITLPEGAFGFELTWPGAPHDLDVYVLDADGRVVASGAAGGATPEAFRLTGSSAGDHYVVVVQSAPASTTVAVDYTLTVSVPSCVDDFDCTSPEAPVCGVASVCGRGPALCDADDVADDGAGDDGPAAARALMPGVLRSGSLCSAPGSEADWFKIAVADAQGLDVTLSWTGAGDLDLAVFDGIGQRMGRSTHANPEYVQLTHLPAGEYLVRLVRQTTTPTVAATPTAYSLVANVRAATPCTADADCDDEFRTQLFRGRCDVARGVCASIPSGSRPAGARCDSDDDCASDRCSYTLFEADADRSVCTVGCATTEACTAALGAGFTCTRFSADNHCVPGCASDLECGANVFSSAVTANEPWDYLTCDTVSAVCRP